MKAVFLDFATMGAGKLDPGPLFARLSDLRIFDATPATETAARIREAEFVFANKVKLDRSSMEAAGSLRFIGLTATGTDNVDLAFARERGIAVCNIRAYCTGSVVEHIFGVLLNLTHSLSRYQAAVRGGAWQTAENFCFLDFPIRELSAMTIGIVGHGELGQAVARTARHFGMQVLIARRPGSSQPAGDGRVELSDLLNRADVVSLHCPLNPDTRHLIGAAELRAMKRDAILVNTARGGLVDSAALVQALQSGEIGGAAIDVLPQEPPVDGDPLLAYRGDNLVMTPHIAWATAEARQNAIAELAANVAAFQDGIDRNRVV